MQVELKHLQRRLGITFIYVTHDQEEALTMSDRIIVMNEGLIEQIGSPSEIYERPKTRFIADFIGETNIFEGTVTRKDNDYIYVDCHGQEVKAVILDDGDIEGKVYLAVRPEKMDVSTKVSEDRSQLDCTFKEKIYVGSITKLVLTLPTGQEVIVNENETNRAIVEEGGVLQISWHPDDSVLLTIEPR